MVDKIGDAHLLHLGADVGWYQAGEPVFAVSDGVVRVSEGPPPKKDKKEDKKSSGATPAVQLAWGNLVVIEHQLGDERDVTTVYGHLANDCLVKSGDAARAGQQIGTIGTARVNGGYKPHLHFGVREGRMAEKGRKLIDLTVNGKPTSLRIAEMREDAIVLSGADELPEGLQLNLNGQAFDVRRREGNVEVHPAIFSIIQPPEFAIVGYGLTTDGWQDPIAFLREHAADVSPAPFEVVKRLQNRGRRTRNESRRGEMSDEQN